jgi:hypothetical protein
MGPCGNLAARVPGGAHHVIVLVDVPAGHFLVAGLASSAI